MLNFCVSIPHSPYTHIHTHKYTFKVSILLRCYHQYTTHRTSCLFMSFERVLDFSYVCIRYYYYIFSLHWSRVVNIHISERLQKMYTCLYWISFPHKWEDSNIVFLFVGGSLFTWFNFLLINCFENRFLRNIRYTHSQVRFLNQYYWIYKEHE